mgnify:FL=1
MNIESVNDEKIRVTLSREDMKSLDITYDEMDYSNIETRRVIWTVLDEARAHLGKDIDTDGRLLIEVCPLDDGGCIMYFSSAKENEKSFGARRPVMKKESEPIIFKAENAAAFFDAYSALCNEKQRFKSAEYLKYGENFYCIIVPKPQCADALIFRLSEYGEAYCAKRAETAFLFERGKKLYLSEATAETTSSELKI